ncbi:nose resistant to fluoxetine protein 6-like isoform X2 [Ostrea edulis]|nr:nose resistant to fluoxetine protein 6-like isoform X2 [Ostrea edulis]XP_048774348.2 nose resistant to fluoxetine protein 6-like isoform X2 [Ostrea edulis]XP_048774349.2 nose resistant to fluoxetine protein 6-like isoform X2 [Ostrea edulis]
MILRSYVLEAFILLLVCGGSAQGQENKTQYYELLRKTFTKLTQGESEPEIFHRENITTKLQNVLSMESIYDWVMLMKKDINMALTARNNISEACSVGLQLFVDGLQERKLWAIKMLDAQVKVPSGVFDGDFVWPGQYDQCINIDQAFPDILTYNMTFLIRGKYFLFSVPNTLMPRLPFVSTDLRMGICLPDVCNEADVTRMLEIVFELVYEVTNGTIINLNYVYHPETKFEITPELIIASVIFSIIGLLLLVGTLYDMYIYQKMNSSEVGDVGMDVKDDLGDVNSDTTHLMSDGSRVTVLTINYYKTLHKRTFRKFLLTFSMSTNGSKVLSTETPPPSAVQAVNGIRVLSMGWVILGHTYFFTLGTSKNVIPTATNWIQRWTFQVILNGIYSVDSFFLLSGLLVSFLTLRELQKRDGKLNWFLFYFHRFWRLTPALMLFTLLYTAYFQYWGSGPFWPKKSFDYQQCKNNWWRNLLYIQNFFPISEQCIGWGWYLANDMQFFVLSPILIYPLYRKRVIGYILVLALLIMQAVFRGVMSVDLGMGLNSPPNQEEFFDKMYQRPYSRIAPYLIGVLTGYFMWKSKRQVKLPKVFVILGWIIALVCVSSVVFGTLEQNRGHKQSISVSALYNSLSKTTWSLGVAWIIFACNTGYGGFINTFLSAGLWSPLSRLTYCAYLVHPVIMFMYTLSQRYTMYFTDINMVCLFLGFWMATYVVAFFVSMALEAPMIGLEKLILKRNKD